MLSVNTVTVHDKENLKTNIVTDAPITGRAKQDVCFEQLFSITSVTGSGDCIAG